MSKIEYAEITYWMLSPRFLCWFNTPSENEESKHTPFLIPSVALLVASRYALPRYGDRRVWVRGAGWPDIVSGYSGVRGGATVIKFVHTHR